ERISPESLGRLTPRRLRAIGVSPQKAAYLLDLAERVGSGGLRLHRLARMSDHEVIEALIQVKGIGVWTAQMFLIFSLGRLDVFPHDDLGVRVAIRNLYRLDDLPDKETSHRIAMPWRPYASVASWYCWRALAFGVFIRGIDDHLIRIDHFLFTPTSICICVPLEISKFFIGEAMTVSLPKWE